MGTPTEGSRQRVEIDADGTFNTATSSVLMVDSYDVRKVNRFVNATGIAGTRQEQATRTVEVGYAVSGSISMRPSADEWDIVLPYIMGGTKATNTFAFTEALRTFYLQVDTGADQFKHGLCVVSRATISGRQGEAIRLVMEVEGSSETTSATMVSALSYKTDTPYVFSGGTITLASGARDTEEFTLVIDHQVDTERWLNATTRAAFPSNGLTVSLNTLHPWTSSETALYDQAPAGATGSLAFSNADGDAMTWTFGILQVAEEGPTVSAGQEVKLGLNMFAREASGGTDAISVDNTLA